MTYPKDEKQKLDSILSAFHDYIQTHTYFDILYSDKIGYVRMKVEDPDDGEGLIVIRSAMKMLNVLFNEIINDVRFADQSKRHFSERLTEEEAGEARRRIAAILKTMGPESEGYLRFLDAYLAGYPYNGIED